MTTPPTPAGWYPDPDGGGGQRYWDGNAWTEHRSPALQPPPPPPPAPPSPPTPPASAEPAGDDQPPGSDQATAIVQLPTPPEVDQATAVVKLPTAPEQSPGGAHRKPEPEPEAEPEPEPSPEPAPEPEAAQATAVFDTNFTPPPPPPAAPPPTMPTSAPSPADFTPTPPPFDLPPAPTMASTPFTPEYTPTVEADGPSLPPSPPPPGRPPSGFDAPPPAFDAGQPTFPPSERKSKLPLVYGAACAALLLVLIGVAVWGLVIKEDPGVELASPSDTTTSTETSAAAETTPEEAPTETSTIPSTPTLIPESGAATDGPLSFEVFDVRTGPSVEMTDAPVSKTAVGEYIVVDMTVTNVGADPATFIAQFQTLRAGGNIYNIDDEATAYLEGTYADLAPGASTDVSIAFDVPVGTPPEAIELHMDPSTPGAEVALS